MSHGLSICELAGGSAEKVLLWALYPQVATVKIISAAIYGRYRSVGTFSSRDNTAPGRYITLGRLKIAVWWILVVNGKNYVIRDLIADTY